MKSAQINMIRKSYRFYSLPLLTHKPIFFLPYPIYLSTIETYLCLLSMTWITSEANNLGFLIPDCIKTTGLHKWILSHTKLLLLKFQAEVFYPSARTKIQCHYMRHSLSALSWLLIWEFPTFILYWMFLKGTSDLYDKKENIYYHNLDDIIKSILRC